VHACVATCDLELVRPNRVHHQRRVVNRACMKVFLTGTVVMVPWTGFSFTGRIHIRFCERYIVQNRTQTYIGLIAAFAECRSGFTIFSSILLQVQSAVIQYWRD
jgi:hypothetical protein